MKKSICLILLAASCVAPASAQNAPEKISVGALLAQDYAIAGAASPPNGGGALFLRKGARLYFCYVSETRQSATVTTEYCKPVE